MSMATPSPQDNNVAVANNIVSQMGNTVRRNPAVTAAVVQSLDPSAAAPAAAASAFTASGQAIGQHLTDYSSQSVLQSTMTGAQDVAAKVTQKANNVPIIGTLLNWASKPLQEIQKDYKFVSAVYDKHGVGAGLLATIGVLAGGAAGAVFTDNPLGFLAGADAALAGERNIFGRLIPTYHDALLLSDDPNYKVSLGRELATGLSNIPGFGSLKDTQHGIGQFVSGITDVAADLTFDPLIVGAKISQGIKSGEFLDKALTARTLEYAKDAEGNFVYKDMGDGVKRAVPISTQPYAQSASGVQNWLMAKSGVAYESGMVTKAYEGGKGNGILGNILNPIPSTDNITRALDHIGTDLKSPVEIAQQYPDLARQVTPLVLKELAKANDGREAAQVLDQSLHSAEMTDGALSGTITNLTLPTRTLGRSLAGDLTKEIRLRAGDTTANEERNLLLPKKVFVTEDKPVLDEAGNPIMDPATGKPKVIKEVVRDAEGNNQTKILQGGLWNGNYANALAGKLRTFTGYKSLSVGVKNMEQSGREVDLNSTSAGPAIYNMALYALPSKLAMEKATQIIMEPDKVKQAQYYGALVKEIVKTAGVRDDSNLVDHIMSEAQRYAANGSPAMTAYAVDHEGNLVGQMKNRASAGIDPNVPEPDQSVQNYGVWSYQHGSHGIIDFKALRNEVRKANSYNNMYLKADDAFTYYTERIFAPLTLFTTGFGIRVASNEALHQIIRNGLGDYLQTIVANAALKGKSLEEIRAAASKLTEAATDEDLAMGNKRVSSNSVTKFLEEKRKIADVLNQAKPKDMAFHPLTALSTKIAPYVAADKLRVIAKFQDQYAGMVLPAASASSHLAKYNNAAMEELDQGLQQIGHGKQPGQNIMGLFDRTDPNFRRFWALNLSKVRHEEAAQDIAKDWLDHSYDADFQSLTADQQWQRIYDLHLERVKDLTKYTDVRPNSAGLRNADLSDFTDSQVKAIRGLVTGADGTIHRNLIVNIANGRPAMANELKGIPINASPIKVLGPVNRPTTANPMERVLETGYRTFINPIVDFISREQIFGHYLYENYRSMEPMIKSGLITDEDAIRFAANKGVGQMIPLIHNPPLRSQFAEIHRNLMPFYFAQEQALKRVGRLINSNPQAFRDFQMINQGMNNPGFVHTDANGTKYIVYPLLGEFGNSVARGLNALGISQFTGLPSSVTGSTASLLSVLPELKMASVGPFANFALTEASKKFPTLDPVVNIASGGYPAQSWVTTLMPNSGVRDAWEALTMDQKETAVHNSWLSAVAAAYYHGDIPDGRNGTTSFAQLPPASQQAIMDKIENNARTNLFVKGILSFFLPLSPGVSNDKYNKDLQTLRSEFVNMTLPKTQGGQGMDLKTATADFMNKYGDRAIAYTVSRTSSGAGGAFLPLAQTTLDWLGANKDIMATNPNGAAYLVPQTAGTPDALKIEQKLLTMHLRQTQSPKDFLNAMFVSKGWVDLAADFADYEKVLIDARQSGNRGAAAQASSTMRNITAAYGQQNPIWYADYMNPTKTDYANKALADLQTLSANNKMGNSPQASGIKDLLASYADFNAARQQSMNGTKTTAITTQITNAWFDYLNATITTNPELTNVVNGVFKKVK